MADGIPDFPFEDDGEKAGRTLRLVEPFNAKERLLVFEENLNKDPTKLVIHNNVTKRQSGVGSSTTIIYTVPANRVFYLQQISLHYSDNKSTTLGNVADIQIQNPAGTLKVQLMTISQEAAADDTDFAVRPFPPTIEMKAGERLAFRLIRTNSAGNGVADFAFIGYEESATI